MKTTIELEFSDKDSPYYYTSTNWEHNKFPIRKLKISRTNIKYAY